MALSLDGTLQTQLDGLERRPLGQIVSSSFALTIPFDGNDFGYSESSQNMPAVISLSTGELWMLARNPSVSYGMRVMYTDVDRNQWTNTTFTYSGSHAANDTVLDSINICEKPDGNIAMVYTHWWVLMQVCRVATINLDGTYSANSTVIKSGSNYDRMYEPYIIYNTNISKYQVFLPWYDQSINSYFIYKYESSNFTSWTGPVDITPASLGNAEKYSRSHALLVSDNDIVLTFDFVTGYDATSGFETTNVYYMVSQDDGATWSVPTAVTSYTGVGKAARHPNVVEKTTGGIYLTFHDRVTFVRFDNDTPNVLIDGGGELDLNMMHLYDGKVYTSGAYPGAGNKVLKGIYVIDPADMSMEEQWTSTTTPGYSPAFAATHSWPYSCHGEGKYIARFITGSGASTGAIALVTYDGVVNTVTQYIIGHGDGEGDIPGYSLDENVAIPDDAGTGVFDLQHIFIDATTERMYLYMYNGYVWNRGCCFGYIDLTESPDPGTGYYTWNEIWRKNATSTCDAYGVREEGLGFAHSYGGRSEWCPESGVIVLWQTGIAGGTILVMDADTGVFQFFKSWSSDKDIPYNGITAAYVYENKIYGAVQYTSGYEQGSWRGLWIYDMVTQSKILCRPGYVTQDNYNFYAFDFHDISNDYVWIASYSGAVRYHTGAQTFEIWNKNNIPGFDMGLPGDGNCRNILYDLANEEVYVSTNASYGQPWSGIRRFNINGDYYKGQYLLGTKTVTDLGLGDQNDLTYGYFERDISVVIDDEDYLWALWDHVTVTGSTYQIYWDHDVSEVDVTNDLVDTIQVSWDIEAAGELTFALANGQVYDQQNYLSSKSYLFRRGRKAVVKFGENVDGTPYWVNQGTFIVEEARMRYIRGEHPVIEITARDMSSLWRDARITLTEFYDEAQPKAIVESLLDDWTVLEGAEYSIPTFVYSHEIWNQWSDTTLYEIIKDVLDHFEYAFFFATDGVFTPTRINFSRAVDHTYSNLTHISEYTPDSTFSNFVNQIRVIGESHDFIDVVYDAELITSVNGTCGWWNETIDHKVWYNEERTKTCRSPYLDPNISTKDFKYFIFKGGGGEKISEIDDQELYCIVEIDGPNLIPVVVGLAVTVVGIGIAANICYLNCGPFIYATNMAISLLIYAILATATYDIEVYAHPVGKEKQTVQYLAIDTEEMNIINQQPVIEEIEDVLCYGASECQRVAEFELNILKYQRKRVRLSKLAHLQDQVLDMITVKHPYSSQTMQLLIANLQRTLRINGEMTDTLEGWRIV
jgi:hypothetical protein